MPHIGVTVYDLLLSCPGDVLDLKDTIEDCVKRFNSSIGEANNIRVNLKHWSTDSFSQFGDKPQNILNKQFINDCDLCVALLGTRFGTPTDNYDSGTEEEIEKMLEQDKQFFLYFVERKVDPSDIKLDQYEKVQNFKTKYSEKGLYTIVKSEEDLRSEFQNALSLYFIKLVSPKAIELQPTFAPNLVISSTNDEGKNVLLTHTHYQKIRLVAEKEEAIKSLINQITSIKIIESLEESAEETECMIPDNDLKEMSIGEIIKARSNKQVSEIQFNRILGTAPPIYKKKEINADDKELISGFCKKRGISLDCDFYNLGNLQEKITTPIISSFSNNTSSIGSDSEKKKHELFDNLLYELMEYNDMMDFFESIDAMPVVSLQIENQGNTYDEDIDVKLIIEKGCFANIKDLSEPGLFFLKKAIDLNIPLALFCGNHDADVDDFSNYPIHNYIPNRLPIPFKSSEEIIEEQQEEYQEMMEYIFCYDLKRNVNDDILCFNIPYLKQNTKMFFPSYLFFKKTPKNLRYEIRSKHSPEVYKGTLNFNSGN